MHKLLELRTVNALLSAGPPLLKAQDEAGSDNEVIFPVWAGTGGLRPKFYNGYVGHTWAV